MRYARWNPPVHPVSRKHLNEQTAHFSRSKMRENKLVSTSARTIAMQRGRVAREKTPSQKCRGPKLSAAPSAGLNPAKYVGHSLRVVPGTSCDSRLPSRALVCPSNFGNRLLFTRLGARGFRDISVNWILPVFPWNAHAAFRFLTFSGRF